MDLIHNYNVGYMQGSCTEATSLCAWIAHAKLNTQNDLWN